MMHAAHLAGTAINETFTTAPHAISYKLTSAHGVPHGHAVALTLGAVLQFNAETTEEDCVDPRGPGHVREVIASICQIFGVATPGDANEWIRQRMFDTGLANTLGGVGAGSDTAISRIAASVNMERLANNPRSMGTEAVIQLLETIR
jgi:alcohol dehydrogenase class IV